MTQFKLGYKHYSKDLVKFKPVKHDDDLTNLRFGNDTLIEIGRTRSQIDRTLYTAFGFVTFVFCLPLISSIYGLLYLPYRSNWTMVICIGFILALVYLGYVAILQYFAKNSIWPADYPVRFNRKTGKIYVYEPRLSKRLYYFPLREIVKLYKPVIKVYDWENIEGMVTRKGFFLQQEFFAAVIDRQVDALVDYFSLWDNANYINNSEWRWLLCYMGGMGNMNYKGKIRGRFWLGRLCNCFAPEFRAANELLLNNPNLKLKDIQFTQAVRPRNGKTVPRCENCTNIFGVEK